jgi:1,4-dihydroxy-2-naphthoyl-CoA hydrolase
LRVAYVHRFLLGMASVDRAGVLFYPELLRHAHDAYEAFMARIGMPLAGILAAREVALPVVHAEADYLAPMRHGEAIEARLGVTRLGRASFDVECAFHGPDGGRRARCRSVHVCIGPDGASRPLPDPLRKALAAVMGPDHVGDGEGRPV